jgi:hypothetical protein
VADVMTTYALASREPVKAIADVLQEELGIDDSHIMLSYEKWNIPKDPGIYIDVRYVSGRPIGNNNYFSGNLLDTDPQDEIQQTVMFYQIQIDVLSFDSSARTRKEEVYMALKSMFAQNAMYSDNLQISRMPAAFADASSLEESKMLNRFTMTIGVTALLTKIKTAKWYETFPDPQIFYDPKD